MRLRNLDLTVAVIMAALNMGWALLPSHIPVIGIFLALPLVFVLPGYMLTQLLFHNRSLDVSHRLLFSLGLSVAIDILSGLLLNMLPMGLNAISWAVLLGLLTILLSLVVAYLQRGAAIQGASTPGAHLSISGFILCGLATVIVVLSLLYFSISAAQQPYSGFTQLWMLPAVQAGKSCAVRLGVRSSESSSVTYRLVMTVGGVGVTTWPSVVLAPREEWDRLVPIAPVATDKVSVKAQLYRVDKPQAVYREVNLTLHSCPTRALSLETIAAPTTKGSGVKIGMVFGVFLGDHLDYKISLLGRWLPVCGTGRHLEDGAPELLSYVGRKGSHACER